MHGCDTLRPFLPRERNVRNQRKPRPASYAGYAGYGFCGETRVDSMTRARRPSAQVRRGRGIGQWRVLLPHSASAT
jgi:hypothetical protein